jgi:hypothetical protein
MGAMTQDSHTALSQLSTEWSRRWTFATAGGWATSWAMSLILAANLPFLVNLIILPIISGIGIGIAQWLLLRCVVQKASHWVWATVAGWSVGLLVSIVIGIAATWLFLSGAVLPLPNDPEGWGTQMMWFVIVLPLSVGIGYIMTSFTVGLTQWWVLRRWIKQSKRWIWITVTSSVAGLVLVIAISIVLEKIIAALFVEVTSWIAGQSEAIWIASQVTYIGMMGGLCGAVVGRMTGNVVKTLFVQTDNE